MGLLTRCGWRLVNDLKALFFHRNPCKRSRNCMAYLSRVRTDSCCRELQATMDERKRANYGHLKSCGSWHLERLPRRVTQTMSQSHKLCFAHETSSLGTQVRAFTRSAHAHRRPSNIRRLSSVMSVPRLHGQTHGVICCVGGDL